MYKYRAMFEHTVLFLKLFDAWKRRRKKQMNE